MFCQSERKCQWYSSQLTSNESWGLHMPRKNPETLIQKDIMDTLKLAGYAVWRMPLGPSTYTANGQVRFRPNPLAGFPDLFGILKNRPGVLFAIEVKTATGKCSEKQLKWLAKLKSLGCVSIVARDPTEALEAIKSYDRPDFHS